MSTAAEQPYDANKADQAQPREGQRRSMPWFKMYADFLVDSKLVNLQFGDQRHFVAVLALKGDGTLDQDCDDGILDRIVAQRLWLEPASIADVKLRLLEAGLISDRWQPLKWEKRQNARSADPTGAERQSRFRQRNALRNAGRTMADEKRVDEKREDENKSEGERTTRRCSGICYSDEFEAAWALYPRRPNNNKATAWRAWQARLKDGTRSEEITAGVRRYQLYCHARAQHDAGFRPEFIKLACTFFGPDRHFALPWTAPTPVVPAHDARREHIAQWNARDNQRNRTNTEVSDDPGTDFIDV